MIKVLTIIMIIFLPSLGVNGQSISSIGTGKIVELESVQSEVTGTLIVTAMERDITNSTKVLIYRSINNANTWSLIDSITPTSGNTEIPDPVISSDTLGNFYLALMRVNNNSDPSLTTVDVEVYKSLDDGQTWVLSGIPHFSDSIADYPQIIAKNSGEIFLVYSYISGFPAIISSTLTFIKSIDGGNTWLPGFYLGEGSIKSIGPDISQGFNNSLLITVGDIDSNNIYSFSSSDTGNSWNSMGNFTLSNNETGHITKPITNPIFDFYGVISHKPHIENTTIYYHSSINGIHSSQILDIGSYAQGYITDDGIVHIVYSKKYNNIFKILYRFSNDSGLTFSNPVPLYSQNYSTSAFGEYQSLVYGIDNLFYLTFCDWSDNSRAKTLIFDPLITLSVNNITSNNLLIYPNPMSSDFSIVLPDNIQLSSAKIFDMKGQIVDQFNIKKNSHSINYDISHLEDGVYIINLESDNIIITKRIIKMK